MPSPTEHLLPLEIITQILIRLPIKSLLRMKTVCKSWHDLLTKDRYFLANHIAECSIRQFHHDEFTIHGGTCKILAGRDGLVLTKNKVTSKYWIHNPMTKHSMILPDPRHNDHTYMTLLYVASTDEYKLVNPYIGGDDNEGYELLTLGTDTSWRTLSFPPLFTDMNKETEGITVGSTFNALHSIRVNRNGAKICKEIVSLDSESETFTRTVLPESLFSNWSRVWILQWNADLGFGHLDDEGSFHVLVLKDYKNLKWEKEIVLPLATSLKIEPKLFRSFTPYMTDYGFFRFSLARLGKIFVYKIASMEVVKTVPLPITIKDVIALASVSLLTLSGMRLQVN